MLERYKGEPKNITVIASDNPLTQYGFDYVDIIEVRMNFKRDLANDLDDVYLEKSNLNGGVLIDSSTHTFVMVLNSSDYANLEVGLNYYLTLNVQCEVGAEFIEFDLKDRRVKITEDTNRL